MQIHFYDMSQNIMFKMNAYLIIINFSNSSLTNIMYDIDVMKVYWLIIF